MDSSGDTRSWAAAHKKLTGTIATVATIIGIATGALTLHSEFFGADETAAPSSGTGDTAVRGGTVTPSNVAKLSTDVQVSRFEELLGAPESQERLQNDEWLNSTWSSPDIMVGAFSNRDSQVISFTVTSLGPEYTPLVKYIRGGIRLRASVFSEIPDEPAGIAGVYPPNARFSYEEFYLGGGATEGQSTVLAASFAANADDEATELISLGDCLPLSVFEERTGCSQSRLDPLRSGLAVTSMTVGDVSALEALAQDGALFFPDADVGS